MGENYCLIASKKPTNDMYTNNKILVKTKKKIVIYQKVCIFVKTFSNKIKI